MIGFSGTGTGENGGVFLGERMASSESGLDKKRTRLIQQRQVELDGVLERHDDLVCVQYFLS